MVQENNNYSQNKTMKRLYILTSLTFILVLSSINLNAQTPIVICPDVTSFSSMTRGYYFTAPTTFTICGIYVEDDRSTSAQSVEIVRFTAGPPPAYSATTNSFVSLFYQNNYVPNSMIAVPNITINAGDVIGVYGSRATVNSYGAAQCATTIQGFPVTLFRSGMQFDLATQQMHDIWNENNYYIGRVTIFTNCCPNPIAIAAINGPATVCEGDTVTYTVPAQTGAVSYNWTVPAGATITSGQNSTTLNVTWNTTPGGQICVDWTDTCATSTPTCLSVTVNPNPTVTVPANATYCSGDMVPATNFVSNPVGATYTWTNSNTAIGLAANGTGNISAFNAANATGSPITGTITVTPTLNGCTGTPVTYDITVNPTPAAPTVSSLTICPNNSATLTATAPGGTYEWYDAAVGGTLLFTGNPYTTPILSANTNYYVQTTSNGCISPRTTVTVTIAANISVNAGVDDSICYGGNYQLQVSPNGVGYSYIWDEPANLGFSNLFNPTVNPVATTTYIVNVTDPNGCSGADTVTISVDPQLSVNMGLTNVSCNGACDGQTSVVVNGGTAPFQYLWTSGSTNSTANSLCANLYSVTITDAFGCTITEDTTVTEPTAITLNLTSSTDPLCNGDCNGSIIVSGNGGIGTLQYSVDGINFQASSTFNNLCAGNYTVTVQDSNMCQNTVQTNLTNPQLLVLNSIVSNDVSCNGGNNGSIIINVSGGTGALSYSIDNGVTFSSSSNFTGLSVGSYNVVIQDANGCTVNGGIVDIFEPLPISIPNTISNVGCFGGTDGWISISPQGGTPPYSFLWSSGGNLPLESNLAAGNYTVTVTDANGCYVDSTLTVTQPAAVNFVTFSADTFSGCVPLAVNFNNTTDPNIVGSSFWDFGDGSTGNQNSMSHIYSTSGIYNVTLTVTDTGGCIGSHTEYSYINVSDLPTADFTMDPTTTTMFDPTIDFYDQSYFNIVNWNWNFGGIGTSSIQNPSYTFPSDTGTYLIMLTVTNAMGCINSTTGLLTIIGEHGIYLPNAFTPDGNGENDTFGPKGFGISDNNFSFKIFDRWGEEIFESNTITEGWDGSFKNKMVPNDVYIWDLTFTDINGESHHKIGRVTIIK
jgi:gliding motility-associated-like protein